jgi:hypothetical protein
MRYALGAMPLFRLRSRDLRVGAFRSLLPAPCSLRSSQEADVRFLFRLALVLA